MQYHAITPDQAYIDYLSLGARRSLHQLHSYYTSHTPNSPSIDTLKNWSRKFNWQQRIIAHNDNIRQKLEEKIAHSEVERIFSLAKKLGNIGDILLSKGEEFWNQTTITNFNEANKALKIACQMISTSSHLHEIALSIDTVMKKRCTNCMEKEFDELARKLVKSYDTSLTG